MSTSNDHDTDPSTPEAISSRSSSLAGASAPSQSDAARGPVSPRQEAREPSLDHGAPHEPIEPARIVSLPGAAASLLNREKKEQCTDPGVAPPSVPPPAFAPTNPGRNTSVDTLLHGIGDVPMERVRVAPQSAGEAVATYHAEHELRAGQQTIPPEPSVVVARLPLTPTIRVTRGEEPAPKVSVPRAPKAPSPTVEIPRPGHSGPKVVAALFLSMAVLFLVFVGLKRWAVQQKVNAVRTDPTASAFVLPPSPPRPTIKAPPASPPPVAVPALPPEELPQAAPADTVSRAAPPVAAAPVKVGPKDGLLPGVASKENTAKGKSFAAPPQPSASGLPMHRFELLQ